MSDGRRPTTTTTTTSERGRDRRQQTPRTGGRMESTTQHEHDQPQQLDFIHLIDENEGRKEGRKERSSSHTHTSVRPSVWAHKPSPPQERAFRRCLSNMGTMSSIRYRSIIDGTIHFYEILCPQLPRLSCYLEIFLKNELSTSPASFGGCKCCSDQ